MKFYVRRRTSPVITIVSLIDILTIILIFFIVTTQFKNEEQPTQNRVNITLPEAKIAKAVPNETKPAILAVKPSGDLFFDDKPITLPELGDAVKQAQTAKRPLAMAADEKASFGRIVEVLDTLQVAGVKNLPAFTREKK